jgi:tetratricopeptide (TPR) repeat protein
MDRVEREKSDVTVPTEDEQGRRTNRFRGPWAVSIAFAMLGGAVILSVAAYLNSKRTAESAGDPHPAAATSAALQPPAARPPKISLPSVAVPATADQLRRELEEVAAELRSSYRERPEALHVAAMMHAQFRQTEEAEKLWRQCVALDPKSEQYRVNLAAVAMDRGNSELAAEVLQETVDQGIESEHVLYHLTVALTNLGRTDEAEQASRRGLAAAPRSAALWQVLGEAQLKLGQAAQAEESLRKAIELGAESGSVYFALANACARQSKHDEAAEAREKYAELTKSQPLDARERFQVLSTAEARATAVTILNEAAAVHAWQRNSLETERLLLRALALNPASAASCRALASLYYDAGMPAEERVVRRRLVEIEPESFEHYLNLAKVSVQLEEPEAAEAALKLAMAVRPGAADAYAALAEFYLQSGQATKGRWFAQEAVRRAPSPQGYQMLATACRMLDDEAGAEAAAALARKLNPGDSPAQSSDPR